MTRSNQQRFVPGESVFVRDAKGTLHIAEVKSQLKNTVWLKLHGREYGVQAHQLERVPKQSNPGGRHLSCGNLSLAQCRKLQRIYETLREEKQYSKGRAAAIAWKTVQKRYNPKRFHKLSDANIAPAVEYVKAYHEATHSKSVNRGWASPTVDQHRIVLMGEAPDHSNRWYVYWLSFDRDGHLLKMDNAGPVSRVEARVLGMEIFMRSGTSPNKAMALMSKFPEDRREEHRPHLRLIQGGKRNPQRRPNPDVDKVVARGQRYIAALEAYAEAVRDGRNTTAARKKMEKAKSEFRDSLGAGVALTIVAAGIGATIGSLTFGTIGALIGSVIGGAVPSIIESVPEKGEEFDEDASHGSYRGSMATTPRLSRLT
jgi:hypothetical protein